MGLFGRETDQDRARAESWTRWAKSQNVYALVSLVLGIFSLIEFGALVIFGVGGIAAGTIALRQLNRVNVGSPSDVETQTGAEANVSTRGSLAYARGELPEPIDGSVYERFDPPVLRTEGRGLAWVGIVTSVVSLILAVMLYRGAIG
jgi:hypothetical protein